MRRKTKLLALLATCGIGTIGYNVAKNSIFNQEEEIFQVEPLLDLVEPKVDETTYLIDTSLDDKEHTFKVEEMRPIIKAFVEINQASSPWEVEKLLSECGEITTSDIYTIEPSEYEMYDMSVINSNNEQVIITYKEGRVISKMYKKNASDKSNKNLSFVNYKSNLYKTEYSSGIYTDAVDKNIAEDLDIWNLEEQLFNIFN